MDCDRYNVRWYSYHVLGLNFDSREKINPIFIHSEHKSPKHIFIFHPLPSLSACGLKGFGGSPSILSAHSWQKSAIYGINFPHLSHFHHHDGFLGCVLSSKSEQYPLSLYNCFSVSLSVPQNALPRINSHFLHDIQPLKFIPYPHFPYLLL